MENQPGTSRTKNLMNLDFELTRSWVEKLTGELIHEQEMYSENSRKLMILWNKHILKRKAHSLLEGTGTKNNLSVCIDFLTDNVQDILNRKMQKCVIRHFQLMFTKRCLKKAQYESAVKYLYQLELKHLKNQLAQEHPSTSGMPSPLSNSLYLPSSP